MLFGSIVIVSSRQEFMEISNTIYGTDAPLMGSRLLDLVMRTETAFLLFMFSIATVVKEFVGRKRKWPLNGLLLLIIGAFNAWLISSLFHV
jgi:hypothetical protein